ncbi:MAG: hypothetical protein GXZ05_08065 [Gammaproteobacteria bacterium]|nr:hypothetical protein [Gammaproteobacteria bacterium]
MAIDAYVGLPGHGKSYGVTEHVIIPSLKQGRKIVTNIPLNEELLLADFGEHGGEIVQLPLDWHEMDNLGDIAPPGAVLVLDEVWRRWPAGEYSKQANFHDQQLLAEHRHRVDDQGRAMRVVLVTQDLAQISAWVRLLVESTYRISKKSKKFYVVSIYMGAVTGARPPKTALLRQASGTFKKQVYQYYSSATQSNTGEVGDESTADTRASILKSLGLWSSLGGAFVLLILGVIGVKAFFSPPASPLEQIHQPVVSAPVQPVHSAEPLEKPSPAPAKPDPKEPPLSSLWRVAGFIAGEGQGTPRVALQSHTSGMRFVPLSDCQFYPSGIDVFCDIEGERITPWSGQGAVSKVYQSNSVGI